MRMFSRGGGLAVSREAAEYEFQPRIEPAKLRKQARRDEIVKRAELLAWVADMRRRLG